MKILITGSAGFIFSNFIRKVISEELPYEFVSIDKLYEPYTLHNIFDHPRHKFYMADLCDEHMIDNIFKIEKPNIVIHAAASSFVDSSISWAVPFVQNNILATQVMIDASLKYEVERFVFVSTDEVYGQLKSKKDKSWTENSIINPRNPYSASKAAGELMVRAAHETHGLPFNITRCCNNYGSRQPPRNLVPRIVSCILSDQKIPIHGNGKQMREWIHADDHGNAILKIIQDATLNETYNVGTGFECTNLEMVKYISDIMQCDKDLISFVRDRKGHDQRYSVDCSKIHKLGWKPKIEFIDGLTKSIEWYKENQWYLKL